MQLMRRGLDTFYRIARPLIFATTRSDPERAHRLAISAMKLVENQGMENFLFGYREPRPSDIGVTNAAGFNKNGDIPPNVLRALGFTENTVGTVTAEAYAGNNIRPRAWRHPPASLVNFLGLPGIGARAVREKLDRFAEQSAGEDGYSPIPVRVNVASTPNVTDPQAQLDDILFTMRNLEAFTDEWEVNESCPNTPGQHTLDEKYLRGLDDKLRVITQATNKPVYIKLGPDNPTQMLRAVMDVASKYWIAGWTLTNTTVNPDPTLAVRPTVGEKKVGGASGDAVLVPALLTTETMAEMQRYHFPDYDWKMNLVGGINSGRRAIQRLDTADGLGRQIQIYTGLIYKGPRLIREVREAVLER